MHNRENRTMATGVLLLCIVAQPASFAGAQEKPAITDSKGVEMGEPLSIMAPIKDKSCNDKVKIDITPNCEVLNGKGKMQWGHCVNDLDLQNAEMNKGQEFYFDFQGAEGEYFIYVLLHSYSKNINRLQLLSQPYFYKEAYNNRKESAVFSVSTKRTLNIQKNEDLVLGPFEFDGDTDVHDHVTVLVSPSPIAEIEGIAHLNSEIYQIKDVTDRARFTDLPKGTYDKVQHLRGKLVAVKPSGLKKSNKRVPLRAGKGAVLPPYTNVESSKPDPGSGNAQTELVHSFESTCIVMTTFTFKRRTTK